MRRLSRRARLSPLLLLLPLVAGCSEGDGRQGIAGELGNGVFYYLCAGDSDAQCDDKATRGDIDVATGAFPPVAVGGRFSIDFESNDTYDVGPYTIDTANDFVTSEETVFQAMAPGVAALVAMDGNTAMDLVHVRFEEAKTIRVSQTETNTNLPERIQGGVSANVGGLDVELEVDAPTGLTGRTFLRVVPATEDGRILAGALPVTWRGDPDVVAFLSAPSDNVVEVQINGTGPITATVGALETTVLVGGGDP
ncbi:hypothetical protein [Chondromyces crocatus]|uniref:DUF4397 domain-containing protein n=1 Tax=Chondromyces crocatus TaxID=52 RepID=A0A0K1EAM5_CHOCO|nr:hypothetical protein [Chondromyces crocatus]AKT37925.1 uncharacterized protein CMC5_020680 [Chondromyces crocatus]